MESKTVRVNTVVATCLWVLSVATVLLGTISLAADHDDVALAVYAHAVLFIAAASIATIKVHTDRNTRLLLDGMRVAGIAAGHLRQIDN